MPATAASAETLSLDQSARETVESIVVAVILAFLFRGFIAEAFVIPTGSMAPTLQGRHMDVVCSECGHQYRTSASIENTDFGPARGEVLSTRCPICRYTMTLDKEGDVNQRSFNGDRILVSKFAYQFQEPKRWDVIVFKFPGNAKINYIKRLIGLPGETLRLRHGDIYVLDEATRGETPERQRFRIQRKPPDKVLAMLQLVDDSRYVSPRMKAAGWPRRWVPTTTNHWQTLENGEFTLASSNTIGWLRYRHLIPRRNDWRLVGHQEPLTIDKNYFGHLITDYYAYNDFLPQTDVDGDCWVGDLAVECEVDAIRGDGEITLDLVEGGTHFQCVVQTSSGEAQLSILSDRVRFASPEVRAASKPTGQTAFRGPGRHSLRFANVDNQLHLWVDDKLVQFDSPTTFETGGDVAPKWSEREPGDLLPAGIGARNLDLQVSRLRLFRDVYYRATDGSRETEYDSRLLHTGDNIETVMSRPQTWSQTNLFRSRRSLTFELAADQFFPLGDNSPESRDARLWSGGFGGPPPYVERELLIGRALAIYWPHGWRYRTDRIGPIPNYQRIGLIR